MHNKRCSSIRSYSAKLNIISFFFNDTATTEIYTLSLHDALPICSISIASSSSGSCLMPRAVRTSWHDCRRSEEHTSELQSHVNLVCRLLLEKKKNNETYHAATLRTTSTFCSFRIDDSYSSHTCSV